MFDDEHEFEEFFIALGPPPENGKERGCLGAIAFILTVGSLVLSVLIWMPPLLVG